MGNVLRTYYQGLTQQLRSEVDFINSLFQHQGLKGEGNETVLRDLLTRFIPKRYGVGTGVVIDRHGTPSRQCDIVIYDVLNYPSLLSLTSTHLFPVDLVYAVIEVKTTLNSKAAAEALENIASVKRLDYIQAEFGDQWVQERNYSFGIRRTTPPVGVVFAYNSRARRNRTFKQWFTSSNNTDIQHYPSLVGCLDMGVIGFVPGENSGKGSTVCLDPEVGMRQECWTFPLVKPKIVTEEDVESCDDVQFVKVTGVTEETTFCPFNGVIYPVKQIGNDHMLIDQSRVLLNFLLLLNELVSLKRIHPAISFTQTYIRNIDRFHFVCQ